MENSQVINLKDYQEKEQQIIAIEDEKEVKEEYFKQWAEHTKLTAEKSFNEYVRTIKSFKDYLSSNNIAKPMETDLLNYREFLKTKNLQAFNFIATHIKNKHNSELTDYIENKLYKYLMEENFKADKEKSTEKIDGAVATIMALDRAIRCGNDNGQSVYDERGLIFL